MTPREYEELVCEHFRKQGYTAETTPYTNDYGIDAFASRGNEKIAIQAKMYGSNRKINRQMVMELHGAKDFFDCSKAIIATDGQLLKDALSVAEKLRIEIVSIACQPVIACLPVINKEPKLSASHTFEDIWGRFVIPLEGTTLVRPDGKTNKILKVNWSQVERKTSNGKDGKIKIEIFREVVTKLMKDGSITREYINDNYAGRASSGILLILSQVPFFEVAKNPSGLLLRLLF